MACSTPYKANTSHKIMPYRHPNPPRSVEEMARGIVYIYIYLCVCVHQPWNALNNIKQREFGASPKTWFSVTMTLFREVPEELHVEGLKSSNLPLGPWDHGTMGPWSICQWDPGFQTCFFGQLSHQRQGINAMKMFIKQSSESPICWWSITPIKKVMTWGWFIIGFTNWPYFTTLNELG